MPQATFIALLVIGMAALSACSENSGNNNAHDDHDSEATTKTDDGREVLYWYDPMHPEERFDEPGPSPFMDMDLVPRYADEVTPGQVWVASGIQQLMNIRTATVETGPLQRRIDTVGYVDYDEANLHHLHPRVEGWIEQLGIADEGDTVRKGQLLFTLYSPELVNAQEELLYALRRKDSSALRSARAKLRALGVQPEAVAEIEKSREVQRALPWRAQRDGVVTGLGVRHGMHVTPGTEILEIADLSSLWVIAEVFDRHADWLAVGQTAEIASSYNPGETRKAEISHVYPVLERDNRTVRARLPVDNSDGQLKPGMWTSVRIFVEPAEDRVYIPRQALIRTGHSARVVLREDEENFRVREVVPGMESGDYVAIREGLKGGEEIVLSGHFLLDSEASLTAGHDRLEGEHAH